MAFDALANFAYSTVLTAPSPADSGTSLVVQAGEGARFPAVPFNAVICPANTIPLWTNAEIVRVTNITSDTLTITRTTETTAGARTVLVGDQIFAAVTKKTLTDIQASPTFTGNVAIGGNTYPSVLLALGLDTHQLTSLHQVGAYSALFGNASARGADSYVIGFETSIGSTTDAGTLERAVHFAVGAVTVGAGSDIERVVGLTTYDDTAGSVGNASIAPFGSSFTGDWFIWYDGLRPSRLSGGDLIAPSEIYRSIDTGFLRLAGGNAGGGGAHIALFGATHATLANKAQFNASAGITFNTDELVIDTTGQTFLGELVGVVYNPRLGLAFSGAGNFGAGIEIVNTGNTDTAVFMSYIANGVECGSIKRVGTTAAVTFTTTSDAREKVEFEPFRDALDRVLRIEAGTFLWKRDRQPGAGCLAQQVHQVYPEAVSVPDTPEGMWGIDYGKLTPLLIAAVQELAASVSAKEKAW